jgi:diphthamide synthase (EF-2-diphthine--ammonia ligase)
VRERGEFHTCVTDGPMFAAPIHVQRGEVVEREGFVYGDLLLAGSDLTAPAGPA